ncbi:MAG: DUF4411 family protein [Ignavibacteriota bacterium]|nr:DUF4411 family protein [Ignavibacteriota bacterium]MCO6447982.1 DUF4411 family protein [Ignavibacterium album]MCZ2268399.1 DUF4411 family protein [Ignavibacteriales bacterium]QKJ98074.1 MAG: DUF4411 family protein [Ignavibacteriota bacterium]HOJ06779.1 DUF4411 family protein [Ignavibacteriaceae bacterium]
MAIFILDSNFFIQAHRVIYPIDVAVGFWNKVKQLADENKIMTIEKVQAEIFSNNDELKAWLETNIQPNFYKSTQTPEILAKYADVVRWANSRNDHYLPRAIAEFLDADNADAWLIAYALSLDVEKKIVTQEVSRPDQKSKIKIPDVCQPFRISTVTTIEMFRNLGETF